MNPAQPTLAALLPGNCLTLSHAVSHISAVVPR
jgi:hypothetical protein